MHHLPAEFDRVACRENIVHERGVPTGVKLNCDAPERVSVARVRAGHKSSELEHVPFRSASEAMEYAAFETCGERRRIPFPAVIRQRAKALMLFAIPFHFDAIEPEHVLKSELLAKLLEIHPYTHGESLVDGFDQSWGIEELDN